MENLIKALVEAQKEFAPLKKSATNPHFKNKFVPLHEVIENVLPVLNKHGLAISQFPTTTDEGEPGLITYLLHVSGDSLSSVMPLMMAKTDPQGQGSAITYARRYALMSILGVVGDEDDDGEKATTVRHATATRVGSPKLTDAKDKLRAAILSSGANGEDYAWVANAKDSDVPNILGIAKALEMGKATDG